MTTRLEKTRKDKTRGFSTTRWTVILSGASLNPQETQGREALAQLCRTYWRPIYSFIGRRGYPTQDAQDLTQDFFAMILETNWLRHADAQRGRFRSFLLKSLENFLHDSAAKQTSRRRGGEVTFVSWDDWTAEAPSQLEIPSAALETLSPDRVFDLRWAATVVEQALARLAEECEERGRLRLFDNLSRYLTTDRTEVSYAKLAISLGVPEQTIKRQLHNLRRRYRHLLRAEVARTVEDPAEVDEEIRHLCAALESVGA